jgi:hypothetical protein
MGETTAVLNVSRAYIKTTGAHHFATVHCSLQKHLPQKKPNAKRQRTRGREGEYTTVVSNASRLQCPSRREVYLI